MADKKKERKNPPARAKIASLSKEQAKADAIRTRTYIKDKMERPAANWLTNDRAAMTQANIITEGSKAKSHIAGPNLIPRNRPSAREALDAAKEQASFKKFLRDTKKADKEKSDKIKKITQRNSDEKYSY